ncbi:MAG TPA: trimethylamine methyltransferase family protein [Desulfobacterales bacterium]
MTAELANFQPKLSYLSDADKKSIHQAVLNILSDIGMKILHDEARALLQAAGCAATEAGMIKIPPALVEAALESAPSNISVYDRGGNPAMELGDRRAYFGTGSDLIYALDSESGQRHQCRLEDVERAARVADAMANIDFIMSFAHPFEQPADKAYLLSFQAMAANSTKPIVCTAKGREDLSAMWQIARMLRGDEAALRERPYFIHYAEPISPLKHPFDSVDKLLLCAETAVPVVYSPAPISGTTAPITIAGHVAQGLAECFCGLVIHQLKARGAPFLMGTGPAVLDMATSQCSYNAPEYLMAYMAVTEMSHFYNLPSWGYAGTSDAQIPDGQATFEAGLLSFMSAMAGANLNHDVGYLDFGRTGSLEMIVILDEMIDQIRRMTTGIPVSAEMLATGVLAEVGAEGNFLTHPHTLKHLRTTQWRPKLINRAGYEKWESAGAKTLLERARVRLQQVLETHRPEAIDEETARKIQAHVDAFQGT